MDIVRKRRLFLMVLSAAMIFMVLAFCRPLKVQAITKPHKTKGEISVKLSKQYSTLPFYYNKKVHKQIAGMSYNSKTNTLTLDRFNHPGGWISARDMGDLKIVVKGTSKFGHIWHYTNVGWSNTLTIKGNGKLILRDTGSSNIRCEGTNAYIAVGEKVKIDASTTGVLQKTMVVIRKKKVANSKAFKISGKHSSGSIKRSKAANAYYGTAYWYEWDKTSFIKNGKADSGSSGSGSDSSDSGSSSESSSSESSTAPAKVTGCKGSSPSAGQVRFSWTSLEKTYSGYEVWASYYTNFDNKSTKKTAKKTTAIEMSIPSGKTIYFKVRGYYTKNGKTTNGPWSSVVKIKAK